MESGKCLSYIVFPPSSCKLPQGICSKLTKTLRKCWWNTWSISPQTSWKRDWALEILQFLIRLFWLDKSGELSQFLTPYSPSISRLSIFFRPIFFDYTLANNPFPVWRSIMWSKELFMAGCGWRVENGQQFRFWEDN